MRLIDISAPLSPALPIYDGDPPTLVEPWARMAGGALADVTRLQLGTHTGTHVDAPAHFLPGGGTMDELDLSACIGPAEVIDLTSLGARAIGPSDFESLMGRSCRRILFKTRNSELWERPRPQDRFAALTEESASLLVRRAARLVGIDYLSVAPAADPAPVHRLLLAAGIVILEGLDLRAAPAGRHTLICLPLRIAGAEAAPARAVLVSDGSEALAE